MPASSTHIIQQNLAQIHERISSAAQKVGRPPSDVTLIAVTKYAEMSHVLDLLTLGEYDLAENRPQQFKERAEQIASTTSHQVHWHFIGNLQRNKVQQVLLFQPLIHAIDSLKLLERIDFVAQQQACIVRGLLEVNVSGEASKHGFTPDQIRNEFAQIKQMSNVQITGLMTMAPNSDEPEEARPFFRDLRELRDELTQTHNHALPMLSMGMSGDYEIGIEEGATHIRIGSAIFEGL
jgi:hypothetical protein